MPSQSAVGELDSLYLMLSTEREAGDLAALDVSAIADARARLAALEEEIRTTQDRQLLEQYDALADTLGTISTFRIRKLMHSVGYSPPEHMTEDEASFFGTLESLVAGMRQAWGLPD